MKSYKKPIKRTVWVLIVLLMSYFPPVNAGDARDRFDQYLKGLTSLQADFSQILADENGVVLEESKGKMFMQRPGKFRWNYESPYDQEIVADGKKVWIFDKELEQITVKQLQNAIGSTPALLLGGEVEIEKEFKIHERGKEDDLLWIDLIPLKKDKQFTYIHMGFSGASLKRMELIDSFSQTTRIEFANEQRNPKLDPGLFLFKPPADVDVIEDKGGVVE